MTNDEIQMTKECPMTNIELRMITAVQPNLTHRFSFRHSSFVLPPAFDIRLLTFVILLLIQPPTFAQDMPLSQVLVNSAGWELVADGFRYAEGPAVDAEGTLYFTDSLSDRIYRLEASGKPKVFVKQSGGTKGMMFGPDGWLFGCQAGKRRIVAFDKEGKESTIVEGVEPNDLVVNRTGAIYFTEPMQRRVWHVSPRGDARIVDVGLGYPNGLTLWPDQGTLVVADMLGSYLWAFRIEPDGALAFKQPYYPVHCPAARIDSGADGMTVDAAGRLYVATHLGVQMFDPTGRLSGVIRTPPDVPVTNVILAGPKLDTLYITCVDRIYRRKTKTTGILFFGTTEKK